MVLKILFGGGLSIPLSIDKITKYFLCQDSRIKLFSDFFYRYYFLL